MQLSSQLTAHLKKISDSVIFNAQMHEYTTFKIGGEADALISPQSAEQICEIIHTCKTHNTPFTVIGNGSNLLVSDSGIRGVTLIIGDEMSQASVDNSTIFAQSGIRLSKLANIAAQHGLSGLEFASGIPGTLGGAIYMNAGAYCGEMKDVVVTTDYLTPDGDIRSVTGAEHLFGYRTSVFSQNDYIVLSSNMLLTPADTSAIKEKMSDLNARRRNKQPLNMPSAGSTFKRPQGHFAGALIEQCGLKGYSIGGAQVSEKHAGFLVNTGSATAQDVLDLIGYVRETVYQRFDITLECEIKMIGF